MALFFSVMSGRQWALLTLWLKQMKDPLWQATEYQTQPLMEGEGEQKEKK